MKLSAHAKKRMKERGGFKSRSLERTAAIVLRDGLCHRECTGRLKRYVDYLFLSQRKGNNIRFFGDNIYIFHSCTLITILKLPNIYKDAVNKLTKRKKTAKEHNPHLEQQAPH